MRKISLLILLLSQAVSAQTESARITVEKLCSPEFHGRGYVNNGDAIAADYVESVFREIGCSFFNNQPFQDVSFMVNTFPDKMELEINGAKIRPGTEFVVDPGSKGGVISKCPVICITQNDFDHPEMLKSKWEEINEIARRKTEQKVVVFDFPGYTDSTRKIADELLKSVNLICPVIELTETKFTWSVASGETREPYIILQKSKFDVTKTDNTVSCNITSALVPHTGRNVIAYVPAKKRSNKYLVYTAHYDHLGRMGRDTYFPGANDNASGTAMLLEIARYFQQNPLDVNVAFIAFCGEEAGLLGSREFVAHPVFPLNDIKFLFNIDIMGSGEEGATVVNATIFPEQFELLKKINDNGKYLVKLGSRGEAANSDHYFFSKAGVPAFFLYTMGPNKNYHDVYDTYAVLSFAEFNDLFQLLVDFGTCVKKK